jgi:adenylate cyclase
MSFAALNLAKELILEGDLTRALEVATRAIQPGRRLTALAMVQKRLGRDLESREALEALERDYADRTPYQIALVHAVRGEREEALRWLERALEMRDRELPIQVLVDPFLRDLHREPRYRAVLRRMNLPAPGAP